MLLHNICRALSLFQSFLSSKSQPGVADNLAVIAPSRRDRPPSNWETDGEETSTDRYLETVHVNASEKFFIDSIIAVGLYRLCEINVVNVFKLRPRASLLPLLKY